jgi:hypothetical protein
MLKRKIKFIEDSKIKNQYLKLIKIIIKKSINKAKLI